MNNRNFLIIELIIYFVRSNNFSYATAEAVVKPDVTVSHYEWVAIFR